MQVYCGTDIIEVDRVKNAINNTKDFKSKIFTKNEILEFDNISSNVKFEHYAGRFAAKEAIYKAMSKILTKNNITLSFLDVEIVNNKEFKNRPEVVFLNENLQKLCNKLKLQIDVSISHLTQYATAVAIVNVEKENE